MGDRLLLDVSHTVGHDDRSADNTDANELAATAAAHDVTLETAKDDARREVLRTPKLLENILHFLPAKSVFRVQRVSKRWRSLVRISPTIQKDLHLRLRDEPVEHWLLDEQGQNPPTMGFMRFAKVEQPIEIGDVVLTPVALNPALKLVPELWFDQHSATRLWHQDGRELVTFDWQVNPFAGFSSFLDTFISDPPCREAELEIRKQLRPRDFEQSLLDPEPYYLSVGKCTIKSEMGIKMIDLVTAAVEIRCRSNVHWTTEPTGDSEEKRRQDLDGEVMRVNRQSPLWNGDPFSMYRIYLMGVVVPTAEEWAEVRETGFGGVRPSKKASC